MGDSGWLTDTAASYDTVADSYAGMFRDCVPRLPQIRAALALFAELLPDGGGPVLDAGCGVGQLTAHLRDLGVDAFGIDLSPGMVTIARREHPGLRFDVGSMTDLDVPDASLRGILAFYSLIHVPDDEVGAVLAHFHRTLRPGGVVMVGFHVGDESHHKTQGYGGHPMNVHVHLRPVARVSGWLRDAGLTVEAHVVLDPDEPVPGGIVLARRGRGAAAS